MSKLTVLIVAIGRVPVVVVVVGVGIRVDLGSRVHVVATRVDVDIRRGGVCGAIEVVERIINSVIT